MNFDPEQCSYFRFEYDGDPWAEALGGHEGPRLYCLYFGQKREIFQWTCQKCPHRVLKEKSQQPECAGTHNKDNL